MSPKIIFHIILESIWAGPSLSSVYKYVYINLLFSIDIFRELKRGLKWVVAPPPTKSKGKAESEILVLPTYDMYGGRVDRVSVDVFLSLWPITPGGLH